MFEFFGEINPLLVLGTILGLVELMKSVGLKGDIRIRVASMATGVGLGVLFQLQQMYPEIQPFFEVAIYGIIMGLTASGLYKLPSSMGFGAKSE